VFDLPFVSLSQFEAYEQQRQSSIEDMADAKGRELLATERISLEEELSVLNDKLWLVSHLQSLLVRAVGTILRSSRSLSNAALEAGFEWLVAQLVSDQHRQLREVSRNAVVEISKSTARTGDFRSFIGNSLGGLASRLASNVPTVLGQENMLYRAKVDLMVALVSLLHCNPARKLLEETLVLLVSYWDDPDSYVRRAALELTEALLTSDLPGARELGRSGGGPTAVIHLEEEVARRLLGPECPDADLLQSLEHLVSRP